METFILGISLVFFTLLGWQQSSVKPYLIGMNILFAISISYSQNAACHNYHPDWSPDGDKIVFDGRRGDAH